MFDTHVHSSMSPDSSCDPSAILENAVARGLDYVALTDHQENAHEGSEWKIDFPVQRARIADLRARFGNRIRLAYGVEMAYAPAQLALCAEQVEQEPFDIVLNSVHSVIGNEPYRFVLAGETEGIWRDYLATVRASLDVPYHYDSVAHLGYCVRYGCMTSHPLRHADYAVLLDDILTQIVRRGVLLEVNTQIGGSEEPCCPSPDILARYHALGGRLITLGSDAHDGNVARGFAEAAKLLSGLGFTELGRVFGRKLELVPIATCFA